MTRIRVLAAVLGVGLLAWGCSGDDDAATTTASETSSTAAETATTAQPTSTVVPATTSTVAETTTIAAAGFDVPIEVHRVANVEVDDVLNVRAGPGVGESIVAAFGAGLSGVLTTGEGIVADDDSEWVAVTGPGPVSGWVNRAFLEPVDQTAAPFGEFPCFADLNLVEAGTPAAVGVAGDSDVDSIYAIESIRAGNCERVVITLGTDFDFDGGGEPADLVPSDVVVERRSNAASSILVTLPSAFQTGFERLTADDVVVVRSSEGSAGESGERSLYVDIPAGPGAFAYGFLGDPARIVVDSIAVPVSAAQPRATAGSWVLIVEPATAEGVPVLTQPIQVFGYANGFEGTVTARVVSALESAEVDVSYTPGLGGGFTSGDVLVMTTSWGTAWGEYSFEIDGLAPGEYVLVVASDDPSGSATFTEATYRFTIGG